MYTTNLYAHDCQLYATVKPGDLYQSLTACLNDMKTCLATNFLLLNKDKYKTITFTPRSSTYPQNFPPSLSSNLKLRSLILESECTYC